MVSPAPQPTTRERNQTATGLSIGAGRPIRRLDDIADWARVAESAGFSLLSVGDGLVSQIPALLLSVSTGLIAFTRASRASSRPSSVK